ncbi:MAG TPA: hypothetical protein ENJ18_06195 [Nannocystis exedens]|nr:hypothetical protein [Nannocystis exedens]
MLRSTLFLLLLLSVAAAPLPVRAASLGEPTEDTIQQARDLYKRGLARFETADYTGAIDLWTDAYAMLPTSVETAETKSLFLYNIATARERAYELDGKLSHLRQALVILDGFINYIPEIYEEPERATQELAAANERRAAIAAIIEAAEAAANPKPEPEPEPEAEPEPEPEPEVEIAPDTSDDIRPGRSMVIAGSVLVGVGTLGLGLMTGGLVLGTKANDLSELEPGDIVGRRDLFARGLLGNKLALAGGLAGGASLLAGVVVLSLGIKRQRSAGAPPTTSFAPLLGPDLAGLQIGGHF